MPDTPVTMYQIPISARNVSLVAARESTRYALRGIKLDPRGHVAATDGRMMTVLGCTAFPGARDLIVPIDLWDEAMKQANKVRRPLTKEVLVSVLGTTIILSIGAVELKYEEDPEFGRFPDYEPIVPLRGEIHWRFNAAYLRNALAALPDENEFVTISITDGSKPAIVWTNGENRPGFSVVMPIASEGEPPALLEKLVRTMLDHRAAPKEDAPPTDQAPDGVELPHAVVAPEIAAAFDPEGVLQAAGLMSVTESDSADQGPNQGIAESAGEYTGGEREELAAAPGGTAESLSVAAG